MLKQRVLSAIVMIAVALAALFGLSPLPFTLALAGIIVLGMWEWAQFVGIKRPVARAIVGFATFGLLLFPIMASTNYIQAARFLTDETTIAAPWRYLVDRCHRFSDLLSQFSDLVE